MIALVRIIFNTPWLMIAILVAGVGVFGFYKGWSIEHDAKIAAMAARDADWQHKIADANVTYERAVAAAVAEAVFRSPVIATSADVERMCGEYQAYCRDGGAGK